MESNLFEVVVFSGSDHKKKMIVAWLAKNIPPRIVTLEDNTKKLIVEALTETPAIYMS